MRRGILRFAAIGLVTLAARADDPAISVTGAAIGQGNAATTPLTFTIARSGDTAPRVYVAYTTQPDTGATHPAVAGTDYVTASGSFVLAAGAVDATVPVSVLKAAAGEPDRGLELALTQVAILDRFPPRKDLTVGTASNDVAAADLNGDNRLDLAISKNAGQVIGILENTTVDELSFADEAELPLGIPDPHNSASIATADVNADGKPDLLVPASNSSLLVLLNTTAAAGDAPTFAAPEDFPTPGNPGPSAVADFNSDGRPDIATGQLQSSAGISLVIVLLNTTAPGAATPSFAAYQTFQAGNINYGIVAADLNADDRPDVAVTNLLNDTISVFINTTAPGAATVSFDGQHVVAVGTQPWEIAAGDLNGDGKADLAVSNCQSDSISVLLNDTAPGATTPVFTAHPQANVMDCPKGLAVAPLDGDALPDLAIGAALGLPDDTSDLVVMYNRTTDELAFEAQPPVRVSAHPEHIIAANLDAIPTLDLVTVSLGGPWAPSVLLNGERIAPPAAGSATILATVSALSFPAITGATLDTLVASNPVTVSGITYSAPIEITDGEYSIDGGAYTSSAGQVQGGDMVRVRLTTSGNFGTAESATVQIGGVEAVFTVTTEPEPIPLPDERDDNGGPLSPAALLVLGLGLALRRRRA